MKKYESEYRRYLMVKLLIKRLQDIAKMMLIIIKDKTGK